MPQVEKRDKLSVDTSRGGKLRINVNITFPSLPCSVLSLDALDLSGNDASGPMTNMSKLRLDVHGLPIESGPEESAEVRRQRVSTVGTAGTGAQGWGARRGDQLS